MTTVQQRRYGLFLILGLASLAPYLYALSLGDLRKHTVEFIVAFLVCGLLGLSFLGLALGKIFDITR